MNADDEQGAGRWPGYCAAHAELCERYDRDFGPFPGCPDPACVKPDGFDPGTQPHLAAAAATEDGA